MTQKQLFPPESSDTRAVSRQSDPQTSHDAAKQVNRSGSADSQRELCLQFLKSHHEEGYTGAEIAKALGMDRHTPSRRLPELRKLGLIKNGPARVCQVQGTKSMTWLYQENN